MTDPIADFLTRLRNGIMARKTTVELPASKVKLRLAELLRDEGFLTTVAFNEGGPQGTIAVTLRWDAQNRAAIQGLRRVSRPGRCSNACKVAGANCSPTTTSQCASDSRSSATLFFA